MKITSINLLPLDGGGLRRELSRTIKVGVDMVCFPLTPTLSPAFAPQGGASRRQAQGERGLG